MKLKITRIIDVGNKEKERIVLKALDDVNVGSYVIFKSKKIGETMVSNIIPYTFWFKDQQVKKNDLVVVYTKTGIPKSILNATGNTSHFFYWNQNNFILNNDNDAIVLLNVNEWNLKFVKE
ncbi:MAG: hypothetical protein WC264_01920 [Candidatus Paceibacterota bacterium]|jgi:hypothetical protein